MNPQQLAGGRLFPATPFQRALNHSPLQQFDGFLQEDISRQ
jgi:hypothetical protein